MRGVGTRDRGAWAQSGCVGERQGWGGGTSKKNTVHHHKNINNITLIQNGRKMQLCSKMPFQNVHSRSQTWQHEQHMYTYTVCTYVCTYIHVCIPEMVKKTYCGYASLLKMYVLYALINVHWYCVCTHTRVVGDNILSSLVTIPTATSARRISRTGAGGAVEGVEDFDVLQVKFAV